MSTTQFPSATPALLISPSLRLRLRTAASRPGQNDRNNVGLSPSSLMTSDAPHTSRRERLRHHCMKIVRRTREEWLADLASA
ncbi:MAG: hypothetical protein WBD51_01935 [Burkholderiaceae bacterium]